MKLPRWLLSLFGGVLVGGTLPKLDAETFHFEGGHFHLHRVDPSRIHTLDLIWKDEHGQPLQNFEGLRTYLKARDQKLIFATNAGIYERGPKPCGLTICSSVVEVPLSLKNGEGNFYLKPNGVFFVDENQRAGVVVAEEYEGLNIRARIATQSGPILLRKGVIHPAFRNPSPNLRQRSGVGVRKSDGQIIFVMSDRDDREHGRVTFHHLARTFLELGCEDALYLDGDISQMTINPGDGSFTPNTFAAMFYVAESDSR